MIDRQSREGDPACVICFENGEHAHSVREKVVAMCKYAFGEFLDDISPQLVVGIAISGLISFFMPPDFFGRYVDNEFAAMALMIVGGIPLYVCATASIPIAVALMMKGLSPGAAFVFLAVGPATNAATVTLIASVMGKKIVAVYLSVISVLSVAAGLALNGVFSLLGPNIEPARQIHPHHEMGPGPFSLVIAGLFATLLVLSLSRRILPRLHTFASSRDRAAQSPATKIPIEGMTCSKCAAHVREAILDVPGVESCQVHLTEKNALVTGEFALDHVHNAIEDAGYRIP
jgi:copper chaperone CopZ